VVAVRFSGDVLPEADDSDVGYQTYALDGGEPDTEELPAPAAVAMPVPDEPRVPPRALIIGAAFLAAMAVLLLFFS
jgi:hypothetical protein